MRLLYSDFPDIIDSTWSCRRDICASARFPSRYFPSSFSLVHVIFFFVYDLSMFPTRAREVTAVIAPRCVYVRWEKLKVFSFLTNWFNRMKTRQAFVTLGPRKCPCLLEQVGKSFLLLGVCVCFFVRDSISNIQWRITSWGNKSTGCASYYVIRPSLNETCSNFETGGARRTICQSSSLRSPCERTRNVCDDGARQMRADPWTKERNSNEIEKAI